MTTSNQKQEILQSLRSLDAVQSEKVLSYIKGLLNGQQNEIPYELQKQKAMREISQALGQLRSFNASF